mmetsp:Transcript_33637/g.94488  ORF Transcript_33637/g.94488 Transcript_33637/m.94488 type:complete len:262 (+) Transcript_33637:999-1784(+)
MDGLALRGAGHLSVLRCGQVTPQNDGQHVPGAGGGHRRRRRASEISERATPFGAPLRHRRPKDGKGGNDEVALPCGPVRAGPAGRPDAPPPREAGAADVRHPGAPRAVQLGHLRRAEARGGAGRLRRQARGRLGLPAGPLGRRPRARGGLRPRRARWPGGGPRFLLPRHRGEQPERRRHQRPRRGAAAAPGPRRWVLQAPRLGAPGGAGPAQRCCITPRRRATATACRGWWRRHLGRLERPPAGCSVQFLLLVDPGGRHDG